MKTPPNPRAFRALASMLLLAFITPAFAASYYATPSGAGSQNGSSWANAFPQSQIQTAITALAAGDTLHLGSGTYSLTSLDITGSGSAGNPKTILGVDTGGGVPLFQGTFNVNNNANGARFISFPGAAHYWVLKNLSFKNHPFVIDLPLSGTTDTLRSNLTFESLAFDSIEDGIRIFNANNVTVKNCTVVRYTKKAFRIGDYTSFLTYTGCSADCNAGDDTFPAKAIPNGFFLDDTAGAPIIHDIQFIDCVTRNNRFAQSPTSYWNGDGFSSESGAYNITFLRCKSYDNHDGGFDNKADNIIYQDCVAAGNKRGFRQWGDNGSMVNCVSAFNFSRGGTGGPTGFWSIGGMDIDFCTFHEGSTIEVESGTTVISDSIISTTSGTAPFTVGTVTLNNTATYRPGSGTNPNYVAANSGWRGTPLNAMDSQTYGVTKGYNSTQATGGDSQAPTVPANLAANSISTNSFNLTWTASTDNVAVTGYEVFRDGVSYATPASNSASVTGLSPNSTYAMTVRARDAAGNWSAQSSAINVTTAASGGAVRIEAGSGTPFTDTASNVWAADHSFTGGSSVDRGSITIANTSNPRIYQTERYGLTGYAIAVPNGTYTLNLHFAETYPGITGAGQRVFSVTAEGTSPAGWTNIDLFAEAGGLNIALVKSASVTVADGVLNLGFTASAQSTLINGIEVVPSGSDTTTPSVPTGLASSAITSNSFTLSWNASTDNVGVTGYEVFRNGVSYATPTGTSVSVTGLNASTLYTMTVRARDAVGNWSSQSAALNVTTAAASDTQAPSVPTGLAANSIGTTSFNLTWAASSDNVGVTGYEVFRDGVSYATPTGTSQSVTGLMASTSYSMTVRARDAAGNWSAQSTPLNVTTSAGMSSIRIEAGGNAAFSGSGGVWSADHSFMGGSTVDRGAVAIASTTDDKVYQTERWGLSGYAITVPNGTYTVRLHFAETYTGITGAGQRVFSVTAEGVSPAGWSEIDVYAQAGGANTALIKSASVTITDGTLNLAFAASVENTMINGIEVIPAAPPDTTAPSVPTGLAASNVTSDAFTLSWTASTDNVGVTGYEVFKDGSAIATPGSTSVNVTGLAPSTTYSMRVRARDAAGNWSAQSTALNVATSAATASKITIPSSAVSVSGTPESTADLVDNNLATGWYDDSFPWIVFNLGATKNVKLVKIAWTNGAAVSYNFYLQVGNSPSGPWTTVLPTSWSSGTTTALETYDFTDTHASYVRFGGNGNDAGTGYTRIQEFEVWGN